MGFKCQAPRRTPLELKDLQVSILQLITTNRLLSYEGYVGAVPGGCGSWHSHKDVMSLDNLGEKWQSFGWQVVHADGHDIHSLMEAFSLPHDPGKPKMIIARTTKGKGVDFMEDVAKWHHGVPSTEQYDEAVEKIDGLIREMD